MVDGKHYRGRRRLQYMGQITEDLRKNSDREAWQLTNQDWRLQKKNESLYLRFMGCACVLLIDRFDWWIIMNCIVAVGERREPIILLYSYVLSRKSTDGIVHADVSKSIVVTPRRGPRLWTWEDDAYNMTNLRAILCSKL